MPATAAMGSAPRLHARLITSGSTDRALYNHLIALYAAVPSSALLLFRRLPFLPTAVSWTAVISAHQSRPTTALDLFISMLRYHPSTSPTQASLSSLFKTISSSTPILLSPGLQLHALALKLCLSSLPFSGSALVRFYSKSHRPLDALKAFEEISNKDEVCYGAIITGLAQNHNHADVLAIFKSCRSDGICSTMYSISGALRAVAEVAALEQLRVVHAHAAVAGLEMNVVVGTALVDTYGKCGLVSDARMVFDGFMADANLVSWNALMSAYAQQGDATTTMEVFDQMVGRGIEPDEFSFLAVLTACSNAGMVSEAERWLGTMGSLYNLLPGLEHYNCLVGAMARVGRLADANRLVRTMPLEPDAAVWRTLLSGCMVHGAADMARDIGRRLLELDPRDDNAYVMLANIYSSAGMSEESAGMWTEMRDQRVKKEGGRSWIEVRGAVHVFIAGDRKHERVAEIYEKLMELVDEVKKLGYEEGDEGVRYHSERLAVAFGMVSGAAPQGKALRVVKNLRICGDCHEFFKYVSKVVAREIVVRDVNRYHWINNGSCNCKDYW